VRRLGADGLRGFADSACCVFSFCARGLTAGAGFVRIFADDVPVDFPAAFGVSTRFRDRDAVDCAGADLLDS